MPAAQSIMEFVVVMRRRVLLAVAGITLVGEPISGLGELGPLPGPLPVPAAVAGDRATP